MEVTVSQAQQRVPVTVFRITGAVTDNQELEALARSAYDAGARNILLDLAEVPYMATSGLRALHAIFTLLRSDTPEDIRVFRDFDQARAWLLESDGRQQAS